MTIRIWSTSTRRVIDFQQTPARTTALQYSKSGHRLIAGLENGEVHVYDSSEDKLRHLIRIECKNRAGRYSKGAKVTGIDFFANKLENFAMVTTNDSRIRFLNLKTGEVLIKTKVNRNESYNIRAALNPDYYFALCASEDGQIFLWNNIEQNVYE